MEARLLTELCYDRRLEFYRVFKAIGKGSKYACDVLVAIMAMSMAMMVHDKDDDGAEYNSGKSSDEDKNEDQ